MTIFQLLIAQRSTGMMLILVLFEIYVVEYFFGFRKLFRVYLFDLVFIILTLWCPAAFEDFRKKNA